MNCANHVETSAVTACSQCKKSLCGDCSIHWHGEIVCKSCLELQGVDREKGHPLRKSPALAAWLSLMPGLGQIYVGYYKAGFITILVVVSIIMLLARSGDTVGPFLGPFLAFFWVFNMIDAHRKARMYNLHLLGTETIKPPTDSPLTLGVIFLVAGALLTLGITFDMDMSFMEDIWPLGLLGVGVYMLWRYHQTKKDLARDRSQTGYHGATETHVVNDDLSR